MRWVGEIYLIIQPLQPAATKDRNEIIDSVMIGTLYYTAAANVSKLEAI